MEWQWQLYSSCDINGVDRFTLNGLQLFSHQIYGHPWFLYISRLQVLHISIGVLYLRQHISGCRMGVEVTIQNYRCDNADLVPPKVSYIQQQHS